MTTVNANTIKIGVSSCLLGQNVRFDGGHKRSPYCTDELDKFFKFEPICPEMAIGMGAPRKSIRQVKDGELILLQSGDGKLDVTDDMNAFCESTVAKLEHLGGYLFCAKSPTCGMERVLEYKPGTNNATKTGVGVFARALMEKYPQLPVEENGRLHDMVLRENFFTRVYAYHDWRLMLTEGLTKHKLVKFHSRYKYLLMAHNQQLYRKLGPMVANLDDCLETQAQEYFATFMTTLKHHATRKNHTSTLQHIQGYFKRALNKSQRAELSEVILEYRQGLQPLLVPITLINHYLREFPNDYIQDQVYLKPHPQALRLRYGF